MQQATFIDDGDIMRIDAITPLERDPNLRRIRVGKRSVATLRAADVESLRLSVGQRWDMTIQKKVAGKVLEDKARRDLLRMLGRRARSRRELKERLERNGHALSTVELLLNEAERDGWINDAALSAEVVRKVQQRRPAGSRLLKQSLDKRGLDANSLAFPSASDPASPASERDLALALARTQLDKIGGVSPATALRRIASLLYRRGFDEETIEATLEALKIDNVHTNRSPISHDE